MIPNKNYIDADEKYVRNCVLYTPEDPSMISSGSAPAKLYLDPECTKRLKDGDLLKKMFDIGLIIRMPNTNVGHENEYNEYKATYYNPYSGGFPVVGYPVHCKWAGNTWQYQLYGTWPNLED